MDSFDNRTEPRKKACLQAFASDLKNSFDIKCMIRDVSSRGCKIVSSQVQELPELIQLVPQGFARPLNGRIVWREEKTAGVLFLAADDEEVFSQLQESFIGRHGDTEREEPLQLEASVRPLGYSDRLAKYNPRSG